MNNLIYYNFVDDVHGDTSRKTIQATGALDLVKRNIALDLVSS